MASTDVVMAEVDLVSQQFQPFAVAASKAFFSLQQLPQLHFLYQISLGFFLQLVDKVLASATPSSRAVATAAVAGGPSGFDASADSGDEISSLLRSLIQQVFRHVGPSVLHEHQLVVALRFVQIFLAAAGVSLVDAEVDVLFRGASHAEPDAKKLELVSSVLSRNGVMSAAQVKVCVAGSTNLHAHMYPNFVVLMFSTCWHSHALGRSSTVDPIVLLH
jgi:hypothetical protein